MPWKKFTFCFVMLYFTIQAPSPQAISNSGALTIDPSPYSRVLALSDSHGMFSALEKLLRAAGLMDTRDHWTGANALLIVVGDSIDKGVQSIENLDLWMSLQKQAQASGGRVVHLLGNHEAEFLADPNNNKAVEFVAEIRSRGLAIKEFTDLNQPHGAFLTNMPLAARVGNWLFAHAGFYPKMTWSDFSSLAATRLSSGSYGDPMITGSDSILEMKGWWKDSSLIRNEQTALAQGELQGVVFGHQTAAFGMKGKVAGVVATNGVRFIKIDSGMAPQPEGLGNPGELIEFDHPSELTQGMNSLNPAALHVNRIKADGKSSPLTFGQL